MQLKMPKTDIYKDICLEVMNIGTLFPGWSVVQFIEEEGLDIMDAPLLLHTLKGYREKLELNKEVFCPDAELEQIIEEGKHIHSVIIKEQMYGNEEQIY